MKTHAVIALLFCNCFYFTVTAQIVNDLLDINNFHIPMNAQGVIGVVGSEYGYSEVPAGSRVPAFTAADLWLAAKDEVFGDVHGIMPSYTHFPFLLKPGPAFFAEMSSWDSLLMRAKYNRVWKVSKSEIEYHKNNYYKTDYNMPEAILNWPAMAILHWVKR